ncbi:hypothetical protein KSW81_000066 [Nannochloris sp. 'desiccata']|nr:hypothetical protein KSW81_000066 [Chlorella desiccata (nom. nud.)]
MHFRVRKLGLSLVQACCSRRGKRGLPQKETPQDEAVTAPALPSKKGIGTWYAPSVQGVIQSLDVSWYYVWGISPADQSIMPFPDRLFTPQFYDGKAVTDLNLDKAKIEANDTAVLAFNEPDRPDQGLTSVEEAIAVWPKLETLNMRLGAPAMATSAATHIVDWFDKFMCMAKQRRFKIDFIPIHWYNDDENRWDGEIAVMDLKATLETVYKTYKKPIWVTEFGLAKWFGPKEAIYPSAEVQAAFVTKACEMMDGLDYVERYAYFPVFPYTDNSSSHLYETDGRITVVGEAYKNVR